MTKDEKKDLMRKWKESQDRKYFLSREQAVKLFRYVEKCLQENGCDETTRFTKKWIDNNVLPEKRKDVLGEMAAMGGYCDCEVLANCYEKYDIL